MMSVVVHQHVLLPMAAALALSMAAASLVLTMAMRERVQMPMQLRQPSSTVVLRRGSTEGRAMNRQQLVL
jgi:hypothetical protein